MEQPQSQTSTPGESKSADRSDLSPEFKTQRNHENPIEAVSDLLFGEGDDPAAPGSPDSTDPPAVEEGETGVPPSPVSPTLSDIAEKLGVEASALYDMEITTGDGEAVKLGKLKDAWQDRTTAERESAERAASLDQREASVIADQQLFSLLAQEGVVPQQTLDRARDYLARRQSAETEKLMALVPELRDEAKLDIFRTGMVETLGKMGYRPNEIVLDDHRQVLVIRRLMQLEKENEALKKAAKPAAPKAGRPQGRSAQGKRSADLQRTAANGHDAQVKEVTRLLSQ
jgi:hypothetical protein